MPVAESVTSVWPDGYCLPDDHCRDVLSGSYDVPFSPATPPVILDLGANVGAFVRWAVKRWPGCTIHAYEPQPSNFALLKRTVEIYGAGHEIHLNRLAVADKTGTFRLFKAGINCGEWSFMRTSPDNVSVLVKAIAARDLPKADILKIDTEGAEVMILRSLVSRLHEFSVVMLECHGAPVVNPIKMVLDNSGFALTGENRIAEHRVELRFVKRELLK